MLVLMWYVMKAATKYEVDQSSGWGKIVAIFRLLHSSNHVAVGLSVGYETWGPFH